VLKVSASNGKIILFIDEIHIVVGVGLYSFKSGLANFLFIFNVNKYIRFLVQNSWPKLCRNKSGGSIMEAIFVWLSLYIS
jgi:hypothetical protein